MLSFYNAICVELIYWLKSTTMVLHLKNSANTLGKNVMVLRIKICAIFKCVDLMTLLGTLIPGWTSFCLQS